MDVASMKSVRFLLLICLLPACADEQITEPMPQLSIAIESREDASVMVPGQVVSVHASWNATCIENDPTSDNERYIACDFQPFDLNVECSGPGCAVFATDSRDTEHDKHIVPAKVGALEVRARMIHRETAEVFEAVAAFESIMPDRLGVTCFTQSGQTATCNDQVVAADLPQVQLFAVVGDERLGSTLLAANGIYGDSSIINLADLFPDESVEPSTVLPGRYTFEVTLGDIASQTATIEAR
jgi:hypothetical protein